MNLQRNFLKLAIKDKEDKADIDVVSNKLRAQRQLELQQEAKNLNLPRINIEAIEFGWIFNDYEGRNFIRNLAETNNVNLFELRIIRIIVKYTWFYYKKILRWALILPFAIFSVTMILYITWIHHQKYIENDKSGPYYVVNFIMIIILCLLNMYFTFVEGTYLYYHTVKYYTSIRKILKFWRILSVLSLLLNYTTFICDLAEIEEKSFRTLSSYAILLVYFRIFYYARFFKKTAYITKIIYEIIIDMKYFTLVFMIAVVGFGNAFYIINRNDDDSFAGSTFLQAQRYSYLTGLGELETDNFDNFYGGFIAYIIWFISTLITLFILLNMLIAIMGDTFSKLQESSESSAIQELVNIMTENEVLINRRLIFGNNKYIFSITHESGEKHEEDWEGNLNYIK